MGDIKYLSPKLKVAPPLFDKLSDDNPTVQEERETFKFYTRDAFRETIAKDLELLLNTRLSAKDFDLQNTSHVYLPHQFGVRDFQSFDMANPLGKLKLKAHLKDVIENFEPRLKHVEIDIIKESKQKAVLTVQITADVQIDAVKETFIFPVKMQGDRA